LQGPASLLRSSLVIVRWCRLSFIDALLEAALCSFANLFELFASTLQFRRQEICFSHARQTVAYNPSRRFLRFEKSANQQAIASLRLVVGDKSIYNNTATIRYLSSFGCW